MHIASLIETVLKVDSMRTYCKVAKYVLVMSRNTEKSILGSTRRRCVTGWCGAIQMTATAWERGGGEEFGVMHDVSLLSLLG